ncbi:MAG TPA: hypothetical protein ENI87_02755 [bacterium]|nr:hypothetical protein [bacterium]
MAKNKALEALAERDNATHTLFGDGEYQAQSWPHRRRVVIKAEVLHFEGRSFKDNQRFVVTNRKRLSADKVYAWYCGRGDSENRIKELKSDLSIDRTSCTRFIANQFRVLMTAAAFVLFQELRWKLRDTRAGRCTVGTIRDMLLKVATRVVSSVRRVVCRFATSMPWDDVWRIAAKRCGAVAQ